MNKISKDKLSNAIDKVSEFIKSLEVTDGVDYAAGYDVFFSLADEGMLFLSGDESARYRECLKFLTDSVGNEDISAKAIESLYQKAILTAQDIHEKRKDKTFEQRLEAALDALRTSLITAPNLFEIYHPVDGLAPDGLPFKVGNIEFCIFDDSRLASFMRVLTNYESDEGENRNRIAFTEHVRQSKIVNKSVGLIEVTAKDINAAKTLALKELSLTLELVNFFSDLIPYQKGHLFLPGDNAQLVINIPILSLGENPSTTFGSEVAGPLMPLSFQQLMETDKNKQMGFSNAVNLLTKKRNRLEDRLLSAIQWSGKATIDTKKEDAFLLYAISLESLMLLENDKEELTYRLRTRVAHLLGKDFESRQKISNKIRDLYVIRSRIVHSGYYQVTDADLSLIRAYSKSCILRILNDEPFASMKNVNSLVQWFNEQVLS